MTTVSVLIDRYLTGKEIEVDAVSDGETVVIPGIMEHIERAGVHSGDSIAVYPPRQDELNIEQTDNIQPFSQCDRVLFNFFLNVLCERLRRINSD